MITNSHPLILIDGVCNLCHGAANFIIDHDPQEQFRFASIQSPIGQKVSRHFGFNPDELSSMVLIEPDGRAFCRSSAALRIAGRLTFPWNLIYVGLIIPRPMRDFVYDMIAHRRYRWFGKQETCRLPSPERKSRFLDFSPPESVG
ncbi:DCC1-like thiol-disulfide oxidoreductase family protein [bacterium]|nr:DCC1-like thiol-disulfide oxidoreductase family protein [bacterium]